MKEIAKILKESAGVTIFTHMRPDGDAIGSALSLYLALQQLNIPSEVVDESDIPAKYFYFSITKIIKKYPEHDYPTYVAVDSSDEGRFGALSETFVAGERKKATINIDHHISNTRFAKYNYVKCCSANCENMLELFDEMGVFLTKEMAEVLMLGLLTDSGNFTHNDVTERTFSTAARLVKAGVDVNAVNYNLISKQSKARADLYAYTINNIRYKLNNRLAIIAIRLSDFARFSANKDVTEGFVDFPLSVDTVEVAVALMENKPNQYKVSLRSKGKADVNAIAGVYGGGGHIRASGCMLFGDLEEVIDDLTYTISQYIDG